MKKPDFPPSRGLLFALWPVFAAITFLYLMGGAAAEKIPFGPPIDLFAVLRKLSWRDIPHDGVFLFFPAAAAVFVVVASLSRSRRLRVICIALGIFLPLSFLARSFKGLFAWILAIPQALHDTSDAVRGVTDGEYYNEGFLVYTSIGWWMLFCLILLAREAFILMSETADRAVR